MAENQFAVKRPDKSLPTDRHDAGLDYDVSDVARLATDIDNMDEVQELFVWQRRYAFEARARSETMRDEQPELVKLYRQTHGREVNYMSRGKPMPFASELDIDPDPYLIEPTTDLALSIVLTTRNDTHVERMEDRTQAFFDMIYYLAEKTETAVEVIVVEWNPPSDRASMADGFIYDPDHPYVTVRVVTVPEDIHHRYVWSEQMPLYQMIAKNVGIRRARGQFIAVTNVDILFSEQLWAEITTPTLAKGKIYRSNRHDVDRIILDVDDSEDRLAEAESLTFQYNYMEGIVQKGDPIVPLAIVDDPNQLRYENSNLYRLHTEACGDFQMLHRDDWANVRGYSELDAYSFHIDSMFALTAFHAGLEEITLVGPHYHIDHTLGTKVTTGQYEINEKKVIKHITLNELCILDRIQTDQQALFITNNEYWGMAADPLHEDVPSKAHWDQGILWRAQPATEKPEDKLSSYASLASINDLTRDLKVDVFLEAAWRDTIDYVALVASGRPIKLWGAGRRGELSFGYLKQLGLCVDGFIHGGDSDLPGGMPATVERATDFWENNDRRAFILISSMHAEAIRADIEKHGYREGQDYIVCI